MSVDFRPIIPDPASTPGRGNYTDLTPFRFWCQKVMPLVYDESLSYYEVLCKVVDYLNKTMEDVGVLDGDIDQLYTAFTNLTDWTETQIDALLEAYTDLQNYVNDYFDNLDVQDEINNKLDQMVLNGTLSALLQPFVTDQLPGIVTAWLAANITEPEGVVIDTSLTISGACADAKATGDAIADVNKALDAKLIYELGSIETGGENAGDPTVLNTRVRSNLILVGDSDDITITCDPSVEIRVAYYKENDISHNSFIGVGDNGYSSEARSLSKNCFALIIARYTATPSQTITDITPFYSLITFSGNLFVPNNITKYKLNSNNMFNLADLRYGYWINNSGVVISDGFGIISGFIPIESNEKYIAVALSSHLVDGIEICWYTDNKVFISRDNLINSSGVFKKSIKTSPAAAKFARIGFYTPGLSDINKVLYYGMAFYKYANYIPYEFNDYTSADYPYTFFESDQPNLYNLIKSNFVDVKTATEYYGKKISFLGDSITTFAGYGASSDADGHLIADGTYTYPGNHCRYPQSNLLKSVEQTYWMILINTLKLDLGINDSWAGSKVSFNGSESTADHSATSCISSQTRINHLGENGTPDIILVNAGTNDIVAGVPVGTFNTESPVNYTDEQIAELSTVTFADAYRAMLIRLLKTYPSTEIVCMLPNFTGTTYYSPERADRYNEIIKEACDYFGVKWIDSRVFGISIYNLTSYFPDNVHPNANAMQKYANDLIKKFKYDIAL